MCTSEHGLMLFFVSDFSQEKEELLQQNAELRVKLESKVCLILKYHTFVVDVVAVVLFVLLNNNFKAYKMQWLRCLRIKPRFTNSF